MNLFTVSPLSTALLVRPNLFSDIQRKTTSQHPLPTSSYKKLEGVLIEQMLTFSVDQPDVTPLWSLQVLYFFYFSRDKACRDHKKNVIRIGYIHKAYCIFLLYSFLVVVVRITVFPCRNKSVMWSFFNYFVVETIPRVPTYKSLSAIGITVLCNTLFWVPQNRFEIVSWNEGRHL